MLDKKVLHVEVFGKIVHYYLSVDGELFLVVSIY